MRSEREIKAENGEVVDYNEDVKTADSSSLKTSASFDSAGQHLGADTLQNNDMSLGMVCDDDDITMSTNETIASSYTRAARVCGSGQPALAAFAGYDVVSKSDILKSHGSTTAPSGGQLANHNSRGFSSAVHLTPYEIEGLTSVVNWLKDLPVSRRNVPKDIPDPEQLLRDVKELLDEHRHDDHAKAVTGLPVLQWPRRKQPKRAKLKTSGSSGSKRLSSTSSSNVTGKVKRHRVRCNKCEPCTREDCRECVYCLDMEKYGGPRKLKKPCISRNCLGPKLPRDTICQICGGGDTQHDWPGDDDGIDWTSWLMECRICFEVVHPNCLRHSEPEVKHHGVIDEDLPSSWDCARCCEQGLEGSSRPRSHAYSRVHQHRQQQQSPAKSQNSPSPGKCRSEKVDMKQSVSGGANGSDDTCKLLTDRAQPFVQLATLDVKKLKLDMSTVSRSNSKQTTSGSKSAYVNKPLQSTIAVSSSSANKVTKPTGNIAASVASSTTQEFHEYDFLSPRVSSRGREITVPRRYLL
jgi:F-box/leucine-rich repeat protein 10/11